MFLLRRKIKKTVIYNSINAINWLLVHNLPTNTDKCIGYCQKCYCDVTSGYPRYPIFCQLMRNAFLCKVWLHQVKIKSYLKKNSRGGIYALLPFKIGLSTLLANSYAALQMLCHLFNIYTQVAVLPWSYIAKMGTTNSLYASA